MVPLLNRWEKGKESNRERERWGEWLLFSFNSQGRFRDFLKIISLLSISTLSLGVGLKYETYMDHTLIFGPSWAQNTIFPIFIKGQLLSKVNRIKEKGKSVEDIFFILLHTPNTHPPWCCNEMFLNISGKNWSKFLRHCCTLGWFCLLNRIELNLLLQMLTNHILCLYLKQIGFKVA